MISSQLTVDPVSQLDTVTSEPTHEGYFWLRRGTTRQLVYAMRLDGPEDWYLRPVEPPHPWVLNGDEFTEFRLSDGE